MKSRHISGIFCFLAAFGLSVFLVGLTTDKTRSPQAPCEKKQAVTVNSETEMQTRIRNFLEADRQTGIELANDRNRFEQSNSPLVAYKMATSNLVEKMRKAKCEGLPADFCMAWDEHVTAWTLMANFLDRDLKRQTFVGFEREYFGQLNDGIIETYKNLFSSARGYGVEFSY